MSDESGMSDAKFQVVPIGMKEARDKLETLLGYRTKRERYNDLGIICWLNRIQPQEEAEKWTYFHVKHPAFEEQPASVKLHHYWKGGLAEHTRQMIGICLDIKSLYPGDLTMVTETDIIIGCYIHDFAKVWKYAPLTDEEKINLKEHEKYRQFRYFPGPFRLVTEEVATLLELSKYDIQLTDTQAGALLFAEGGYSAANFDFTGRSDTGYTGHTRNPLAVMVSIADLYSACLLGGTHADSSPGT